MSKYFKLAFQDNDPIIHIHDYCKKYDYNPVLTVCSETLDISIVIAERHAGNKLKRFALVFSKRNVLSYIFKGKYIDIDSLKENKEEKKLLITVSMYDSGVVSEIIDLVEELNLLPASSGNHEELPSDDLRKAVDSIYRSLDSSCSKADRKSRVALADLVTICNEIKNIPVTYLDIDLGDLIAILRRLNSGT